jgi:hypothetical protein
MTKETQEYNARVEKVEMLMGKLLKLIPLKSKIQKPEIKDKLQKYIYKLQKELERNESLLEIQDQKDEIYAFAKKVNKLETLNSITKDRRLTELVGRLQEKVVDKFEELDDLETRQFELELPEKQKDLNSLSSKMQEIKKQIELNSNTSNDRGLG